VYFFTLLYFTLLYSDSNAKFHRNRTIRDGVFRRLILRGFKGGAYLRMVFRGKWAEMYQIWEEHRRTLSLFWI